MIFIKNPLEKKLVMNFMDDSWIKKLLIWIINHRGDLEIHIDWGWEYKTIKLTLSNPIRIIGLKNSTMIFWDEFLCLNKNDNPIKFIKELVKDL